jgi:HEAT repeat protein
MALGIIEGLTGSSFQKQDISGMPLLLENKQLPAWKAVRVRIAQAGLRRNSDESSFLVGQIRSPDVLNRLGALWALERIGPGCGKDILTVKDYALAMSKSKDPRDRLTAAAALGALGQESLGDFVGLINDADSNVKKRAILSLGKHHEQGLAALKQLASDVQYATHEELGQSLGHVGEKALPTLQSLAKHRQLYGRCAGAIGMGIIGGKAQVDLLSELAYDPSQAVIDDAAYALGAIGADAQDALLRMARDKSPRIRAASVIGLSKNAGSYLQALSALADDQDASVRMAAKRALSMRQMDRSTMFRYLIGLDERSFCTPFLEESQNRLVALQNISDQLAAEFPKDYVGLILVGNTSKGNLTPESDLDWAMIAHDYKVLLRFKEIAGTRFDLCRNATYCVNPQGEGTDEAHLLFQGVFIGDRKRLNEARRKTLEKLDRDDWEKIRGRLLSYDTEPKNLVRFSDFTRDDLDLLKNMSALLHMPPDFAEMKKIYRRRQT